MKIELRNGGGAIDGDAANRSDERGRLRPTLRAGLNVKRELKMTPKLLLKNVSLGFSQTIVCSIS
jgi:hypothetical protein